MPNLNIAVVAVASIALGLTCGAFLVNNGFRMPGTARARVARKVTGPEADPATPEAARILYAQLATLRKHGDGDDTSAMELALHTSLGHIYEDSGDFPEAIRHYTQARNCAVRLGDSEKLVSAQTLLGTAYAEAGRLRDARQELEAAFLLMDRKGPNAFATLRALGNVRRDTGKLEEALELYKQALHPHRHRSQNEMQGHGREAKASDDVAGLLTDMGLAYHNQGQLDTALSLYRQALEQQSALGDKIGQAAARQDWKIGDAVELSRTYNHLGRAIHDKGDVEQAHDLYRKALRIQQKALRKNHPSIIETLMNIARAQRDAGEDIAVALATLEWGESLLQKDVVTKEYGTVLTMKADLLREKGDLQEALTYAKKALQAQENVPGGQEVPDLAIILNGLGSVLHDQQDYAGAAKHYMRALSINLKTVGSFNPETASTYNNLGNAYQDVGDDESAEKYYRQCLEIQQKVYGDSHPELAVSHNNIGTILVRQGRLQEGEEAFMKALEVVKASGLPPTSPERGVYEENLAAVRSQLHVSGPEKDTKTPKSPTMGSVVRSETV